MKRNKSMKQVFFFSLLLIVPIFAMSQPGPGKRHHDGPPCIQRDDSCRKACMDDKLAKELSLTEEQKQKLSKIHAAHYNEMKALRETDSINFANSRELHQKLRAEMEKEIKQILTDEQKAKFDTMKADKKCPYNDGPNKGGKHKGGSNEGAPGKK
jgi:Spy/CpxP family protein refolding chaperone